MHLDWSIGHKYFEKSLSVFTAQLDGQTQVHQKNRLGPITMACVKYSSILFQVGQLIDGVVALGGYMIEATITRLCC